MADDSVRINRAPVLTLWGAVTAERAGHDRSAALTLGKAVAGLNAQSKGRALGMFGPPKEFERTVQPKHTGLGEDLWVTVCSRPVPAKHTEQGLRAVVGSDPIDPRDVERYLQRAFGDRLGDVRAAMEDLARAYDPPALEAVSYELYEKFRPRIASGERGWGQKGELDLGLIRGLAPR
jgi:hypothetical protein